MKKLLIILFLNSWFSFSLSAQSNCFPFQKVPLKGLDSLLLGNWEYSYSFNEDTVFQVNGKYHQTSLVPYRIEFNKSSKKTSKKIDKNFLWLKMHRDSSVLKNIEFWVDDKGMTRFPSLVNKSTNSDGKLKDCTLKLFSISYPNSPSLITINSISKGILIISKYQGDERKDFHVFVIEK